MKSVRIAWVALIIALLPFASVKAQTADDIIQKHLEAIGGADNWKKINSIVMNATSTAQGMEIPITITRVHNKGMKVEFSVSGMTGYVMVTDKEGWNFMPFAGQQKPEPMSPEMVKEMQDGFDVQGSLIDYKAKGSTVTYLGKDDVEGTECFKLKLVTKSGKEETMFFDASNYYHIRSVEKIKANGKEEEQVSNYGNFQKQPEGVVIPMSIDEGNGPMTVKSVAINKNIPDNIFVPGEVGSKK
jgi:outer membrane lipoprotein-sorting protein